MDYEQINNKRISKKFALYIISAINGLVVGGCHFQTFWVGLKPVGSNFLHIFGVRKKKKKKISRKNRFFSEKNRFLSVKIGFFRRKIGFIGKNRFYRKKSAIFRRFFFFRFFHCKIFSRPADFRFFSEKSANFGEILFPGCMRPADLCCMRSADL